MNGTSLAWPAERTSESAQYKNWFHSESNIMLDFHGNPNNAKLSVLSDGNHHMALQPLLTDFVAQNNSIGDVFYVTLPPRLLKEILENGGIRVGNIELPINPDVILSPPTFLEDIKSQVKISSIFPFVRNQGSVLLIKKGNPKKIYSVEDLYRNDVKIFISNPLTEGVSHRGYRETLVNLVTAKGLHGDELARRIDTGSEGIVYGTQIHHREAPQFVANGACDVAIVYYHLALRYVRIFPQDFDFIPLGGTKERPAPDVNNIISTIYAGLLNKKNPLANQLLDFFKTGKALTAYRHHGLLPI